MDSERTWVGVGERPIRVGLAGLGNFGRLHASVLASMRGIELVAFLDPSPTGQQWAGERFSSARFATDFDDFLGTPDLDAIYLVTPEDLHAPMAMQAIERGLPIFMEKPLATNSVDGMQIVNKANVANIYLQIGFLLRYDAQMGLIRQQLESGAFGEIITIHSKRSCSRSWFETYADRAHSAFETVIHDIDLALWLLGDRCTHVYAVERSISDHKFPEATVAILQFSRGAVVSLETNWLVPDRAPANVLAGDWQGTIDAEMQINASRQTARLRLLETGLDIWTDNGTQHPETSLWPFINGQIGGALRAEDENFIEAVRLGRPSSVASLEDALHGIEIAEAIVRSASEQREVRIPG